MTSPECLNVCRTSIEISEEIYLDLLNREMILLTYDEIEHDGLAMWIEYVMRLDFHIHERILLL